MSRTNETRHIEWHETCKCKCRLYASVCNNRQRWNDDKCRCECKELIDKGVCDKGFIWHRSNYECECECSYTICVALTIIALAFSNGIGPYFAYSHWYLKKILLVLSLAPALNGIAFKEQFNELINRKSKTNRDQKSNLLILQRHKQY